MKKLLKLFVLVGLFAPPVFAGDFDLKDVPLLRPYGLYRTARQPFSYFMIARGADGNTYVVVKEAQGLRVPKLLSTGDGTSDFRFANGERVLIPSLSQHNFSNFQQSATLYSPNNGPKSLVAESNLSYERLIELGFAGLLRPVVPQVKTPAGGGKSLPLNMDGREVMIEVVGASDNFRVQFDSNQALREIGFNSNEAVVLSRLSGLQLSSGKQTLLLVKPESASRLIAQLKNFNDGVVRAIDFAEIRQLVNKKPAELNGSGQAARAFLELANRNPDVQFERVVAAVIKLSGESPEFWENLKKQKSQAEVYKILLSLADTLGTLASMHQALVNQFHIEVRLKTDLDKYRAISAESVKVPLYNVMAAPLEKAGAALFTVLDRFNHPEARKLILHSGLALGGVGHRMYAQKSTGSDRTYLQLYFDYLRQSEDGAMEHLRSGNFLNKDGEPFRVSYGTGGLFQALPDINAELVGGKDIRPFQFRFGEGWIMAPLANLGRNDRRQEMIEDVLQVIIELDKKAEYFAQWRKVESALYELARFGLDRAAGLEYISQGFLSKPTSDRVMPRFLKTTRMRLDEAAGETINKVIRDNLERDSEFNNSKTIFGHVHLYSLIMNLSTGYQTGGYTFPGFSEISYQKSLVEILTKLLESAKTSIINEGTYVTALEAAITLGRSLEASPDRMDRELRLAVRHMNAVIQNELLTSFSPAKIKNAINVQGIPKYEFKMTRPPVYTCAHLMARL